jgi:hypothetical protein
MKLPRLKKRDAEPMMMMMMMIIMTETKFQALEPCAGKKNYIISHERAIRQSLFSLAYRGYSVSIDNISVWIR